MSYQVLARKWRPRNFTELVGQEHVQRTLINALDNDQLHHAFMFTGTRGVGKTTIARILAKSLNCEKGITSQPCGECSACREITDGHFVDLIEVDAASKTKVEDTRELLENVQYTPSRGRYKVYLIDEVHMLSTHSFNALLKTLEEPPPHVKFLFATTDPQKLPVTILSRCLQFNLKRIPVETITEYLTRILQQENISAEPRALLLLARAADGSMRDALSLVDQAIAYGKGELLEADVRAMLGTIDKGHVISLLQSLQQGDANALLQTTKHIEEQAFDFSNVLAELTSALHEIALAQMVPDALDQNIDNRDKICELAGTLTPEEVQLFYQIGITGRKDLPLAADLRSGFEMVLLRMLAFQPAGTQAAAASHTGNPATGNPAAGNPATGNHSSGNNSSGNNSSGNQRQAATRPAATVKKNNDNPQSMPAQHSARNPWHTIVENLKLSGITLQMANQCVLKEQTDEVLHIQLDGAHKQLLNKTQQERLQNAVQQYLGKPVNLLITTDDEIADETPAQREKRKSDEKQLAAQKSIENDSNVKALIDTFGAQVDTRAIQPVDPEKS